MTSSAVRGLSALVPVLMVSTTFAGATVRAASTWKADFETGNLSQFMGSINAANGTRQNIEFIGDTVEEGKLAGKFTIHADDTFGGTQMRVQITHSSARTGEGEDVFMSFYFLVATDPMVRANIAYWETNGSYHNMMTWFLLAKPGGGTTLNFGTGNLGNSKHLFTGDVSVGQWHQIAFHIHWSQSATGEITFWLDGTQVVDEKAANKPDGNPLFFQAGIQRATRATQIDTVYFDNFLESDTMADMMLAPAQLGGLDAGAADGGSGDDGASGGASGSGGLPGGGTGGATVTTGAGGAAPPASGAATSSGCALAGESGAPGALILIGFTIAALAKLTLARRLSRRLLQPASRA